MGQADRIASGLEAGPVRYIAALSLMVNLALFLWLMRVQRLRVEELKESAKAAERLGGILEQHNQAARALDKAMEFVMAQLPRKRQPPGPPHELGPEKPTNNERGLPK